MNLTLEHICHKIKKDEDIIISAYGYIILEDGTILSMVHQFIHGLVLALLYPDDIKKFGLEAEIDYYDFIEYKHEYVFKYQKFELHNHNDYPIVRISVGGFLSHFNISKGINPATSDQILSVSRILKKSGYTALDKVNSDYGDILVRNVAKELEKKKFEFDPSKHGKKLITPMRGLNDKFKS